MSGGTGRDFVFDARGEVTPGDLKVELGLQAQPPSRVPTEMARQSKSGVGRHRPPAVQNRQHSIVWYAEGTRQSPRREAKGPHKVLAQDLAGMDRPQGRRAGSIDVGEVDKAGLQVRTRDRHRQITSVIVAKPHVVSITIRPDEAYPPLNIDTYRPLPAAIAGQALKIVARYSRELLRPFRRVELQQLRSGTALQLRMEIAHMAAGEDASRALVGKASDHPRRFAYRPWYVNSTGLGCS